MEPKIRGNQNLRNELLMYSASYIIRLRKRGVSDEKIEKDVDQWLNETLHFYMNKSSYNEENAINDFKRRNPHYYDPAEYKSKIKMRK